jgi:hypothetical protein
METLMLPNFMERKDFEIPKSQETKEIKIVNKTETKKKKKKCKHCNKKIKGMDYECRCGKKFCIACLSPETHNCQFDYKENGRNLLGKKLERVVNAKVTVI